VDSRVFELLCVILVNSASVIRRLIVNVKFLALQVIDLSNVVDIIYLCVCVCVKVGN